MSGGFLITLEGTDGVGKSTQGKLLAQWLRTKKKKVILTREPGGGNVAEVIRKILLDPATQVNGVTELFLYEAARANHMDKVIRPALKKNFFVLCDRFTDATVAYQGFARKIPLKAVHTLNAIATGSMTPHLTLWLDLPPGLGLKNARARKKKDRLENQGLKFQKMVRQGYLHQFKKNRRRIVRVEIQPAIKATQDQLRKIVSARFKI